MRVVLVVLAVLASSPAWAQDPAPPQVEQVVTPTIIPDRCCEPAPAPCEPARSPCAVTVPVRYEMRSKPLFWTGVALAAGGATLTIASMSWARTSAVTTYATAPCGTEPFLTRLPIAACEVSTPLLASGLSMIGSGVGLMIYGGERVAVGTDGRHVTVRVRF